MKSAWQMEWERTMKYQAARAKVSALTVAIKLNAEAFKKMAVTMDQAFKAMIKMGTALNKVMLDHEEAIRKAYGIRD